MKRKKISLPSLGAFLPWQIADTTNLGVQRVNALSIWPWCSLFPPPTPIYWEEKPSHTRANGTDNFMCSLVIRVMRIQLKHSAPWILGPVVGEGCWEFYLCDGSATVSRFLGGRRVLWKYGVYSPTISHCSIPWTLMQTLQEQLYFMQTLRKWRGALKGYE